MSMTILGLFNNRADAESTIADLEASGYAPKDISIVMRDQKEGLKIAHNTGANVAEGAATGATTGIVLGGLAGLLSAVAIPGLGAFLIGGPIAASLGLTGAAAATVSGAATGAVAGGVLGALMGLGVPEEDAHIYEDRVKEGAILLTVPVRAGEKEEVLGIFDDNDATDVKAIANTSDRFERTRSRRLDADTSDDEQSVFTQGSHFIPMGAKGGRSRRGRT